MMEREYLVYVDLNGVPILAVRLWARSRNSRQSASFEYDTGWLAHSERFSLDPALTVGAAPFHTSEGMALFGALGDSAPDRWGRTLMQRQERRRAQREGGPPRTLLEIDY
jgi:serine/threonine-protein kinase HipA